MTQTKNVTPNKSKRIIRFFLFGNYYLGFCIVALSFETALKNGFSIPDASYYLLVFFSVVIYYTHAYISDSKVATDVNQRSDWYFQNKKLVFTTQVVYTVVVAILVVSLCYRYAVSIKKLSLSDWLLLFVFPVVALFYYNSFFPKFFQFRIRNVALLKPFLIGFVCTGAIVIYPLIFHSIQELSKFHLSWANGSYFITNWLFTTAIAIMFDIKDFAADHNYHLKTFVVTRGLRHTIYYILLPLSISSFFSFTGFAVLKQFTAFQIAINAVPFFLLIYTCFSFRHRHGILYYLFVIDGLLLVKAVFGIIAMEFVN